MAGSSSGHNSFDSEQASEVETFDDYGECHSNGDGLLNNGKASRTVNDDLIFMERSDNGLSAERLEPFTGKTFPSLEDARDFYYEYAKFTGFTIRTNRVRHSLKTMAIIGRDFVCSREGFRAAKHTLKKDRVLPPRPVTREGCKAMIRLAARDGGIWVVTKFIREHNHKLMPSCQSSGELPIVNILSEEEKDKKIQDLSKELQQERDRSAAFQKQLHMIIKDLEYHAEFMSVRVEDIVKSMKGIELEDV